jgi:anti-sigma regulatory factor (Ser/Thr protein kinase)
MTATVLTHDRADTGFKHDALLYAGLEEFLEGTVEFISDGLNRGEAVLAAVSAAKIEAIRGELGSDADAVLFTDILSIGRNPACIIPVWRRFVTDHVTPGRPARGIGEPVWRGRTQAELAECHRHEALLNVAFVDSPPWWLRCGFDTAALTDELISAARFTHPHLSRQDGQLASGDYPGVHGLPGPFEGTLPDPSGSVVTELSFTSGVLDQLRREVARRAAFGGLSPERAADLALAANEVASNSIIHGGGHGHLRIWHDDNSVICDVQDGGHIVEPLTGRRLPGPDEAGGRGLWMANHLCDLVQIRSSPGGTTIRLFMDRP